MRRDTVKLVVLKYNQYLQKRKLERKLIFLPSFFFFLSLVCVSLELWELLHYKNVQVSILMGSRLSCYGGETSRDLVNPYLFVPKARQNSFFSGAGFYSFSASSQVLLLPIINLSSYSWVGSEQNHQRSWKMKYLPAPTGKKAYQPCPFSAITFLFYFIHFLDGRQIHIHTHIYIFPLCVNTFFFFLLSIFICNECNI